MSDCQCKNVAAYLTTDTGGELSGVEITCTKCGFNSHILDISELPETERRRITGLRDQRYTTTSGSREFHRTLGGVEAHYVPSDRVFAVAPAGGLCAIFTPSEIANLIVVLLLLQMELS